MEREDNILKWHSKRQQRMRDHKSCVFFYANFLNKQTLCSFLNNFNMNVFVNMSLAALCVYIFLKYSIAFDINPVWVVSPIVFPLAFSINTDFQRREKVLEDLAHFKSSGMLYSLHYLLIYFPYKGVGQALPSVWKTLVSPRWSGLLT